MEKLAKTNKQTLKKQPSIGSFTPGIEEVSKDSAYSV